MLSRLRALFTTVPRLAFWARLLGLMVALLAVSWLLDRLAIAAWHVDIGFLFGFGVLAAFGTSVIEEALFRGVLLRPPPTGESGLWVSALSAILLHWLVAVGWKTLYGIASCGPAASVLC